MRPLLLCLLPCYLLSAAPSGPARTSRPPERPVPGISDEECSRLNVPTLIFRSGASDPNHTRATTERLHEVIPGSRLVEPPWGDREWNERSDAARTGTGYLFERWPLLLPQLLEFADGVPLVERAGGG